MICPSCKREHEEDTSKCEDCKERDRKYCRKWRWNQRDHDSCDSDRILDGREYKQDEVEFMLAMQNYKHYKKRPFPTWHEVLEVAKSLGYRKVTDGLEGKREEGGRKARESGCLTTCRDER